MSAGPGRIERAIVAAFAADPDNALTVEELCERVYRVSGDGVAKKHRVAVLRATKALLALGGDLACLQSDGLGKQRVMFLRYSVMSYAMARLKTDFLYRYRSKDRRRPSLPSKTEDELRAELAEGGSHRRFVIEGGAWWRDVQEWTAERDGDMARASSLRAERMGRKSLVLAGLVATMGRST